MDSFEVTAKSADVLEPSELVAEMQDLSENMKVFPLLWNGYTYRFEEVHGGYVASEGYHLVKLSCGNMTKGSIDELSEGQYEVHIDDTVFNLETKDYYEFQDGRVYTLALKVTGYEKYPYSFAEEMREQVDGRWTEYDFE